MPVVPFRPVSPEEAAKRWRIIAETETIDEAAKRLDMRGDTLQKWVIWHRRTAEAQAVAKLEAIRAIVMGLPQTPNTTTLAKAVGRIEGVLRGT